MPTLRLSIQSSALGDAVFPLLPAGDRVVIGADAACDVCLPGPGVAVRHAVIRRAGIDGRPLQRNGWTVAACEGVDDLLLDGRPVGSVGSVGRGDASSLTHGSVIRIGGYVLTVRLLTRATLDGSSPGLTPAELGSRIDAARAAAVGAGGAGRSGLPNGEAPRPPRAGVPGVPEIPRVSGVSGLSGVAEVLVVINGPARGRATPRLSLGSRLSIGRSRSCGVTLSDPRVSRRHAWLGGDRGGLWIRNAGGVGGVWVNGRATVGRRRLGLGDLVDIGGTRFEVRHSGRAAYERIATPSGPARSGTTGRLVRLLRSAGGRRGAVFGPVGVLDELERWEVVDPVGLGIGLLAVFAGLVGILGVLGVVPGG